MNTLKEIRQSLNITQIEAAKILGISRRSYQKYESSNDANTKYEFLVYKMVQLTKIDEENGVLTIEKIIDVVSKVLENYEVKSCFLFGSYAKGKANGKSDVDLLIDSNVTGLDFFGLIEELRENLHKKVDLLTLDSISNSPDMLKEILKDGIKIYGQYKG